MKIKSVLLTTALGLTTIVYSQNSFFEDAFEHEFVKSDPSEMGTSVMSGLTNPPPAPPNEKEYTLEIGNGQKSYQTITAPMMLAVLRMYKATNEGHYLETFVQMTKNVQDHRDDEMQGPYEGNAFPYKNHSNGTFLGNWTPGSSPSRPLAPTWSDYNQYDSPGTLVWYAPAVYSGEILYPMIKYIHLVRKETPALANQPIILSGFNTHGDYANWLEGRVKQTIEAHYDENFQYDSGTHRRDIYKYGLDPNGVNVVFNLHQGVDDFLTPHNYSTSIGRCLALLYDCTSSTNYKNTLRARLEHMRNNWYENAHLENFNTGFTWYEKQVGIYQTHKFEEIAHGIYAVQMALHCAEYGILGSNGMPLYSEDFIRRLTNTFTRQLYKQPTEFWASLNSTDDECNACTPSNANRYKRSAYGWMDLTLSGIPYTSSDDYRERDIYNILSDFYVDRKFQHPEGWGLTGSIPLAMATQVYFFKKLNELLEPISVLRSTDEEIAWAGVEGGDIDNDGIDEIVGIRNTVNIPQLISYKIEVDGTHPNISNTNLFAKTKESPVRVYRDVIVGDFNDAHVGEEIMAISAESGNIYMFQYSAGYLWDIMDYDAPAVTSKWRGLAAGDFVSGNDKDEFVAVRNMDGRFFMFNYHSNANTLSSITSWYGPVSNPDWGRISCGDLDGDGRKDDIVAIENSLGNIYTFLYNEQTGEMEDGPSYTVASNASNWTDVTCGKFCNSSQPKDDIFIHRELDGDATVFRIENNALTPIKGTYLTSGSHHDIWGAGNLVPDNARDELICLRNIDGDVLTYIGATGCETVEDDEPRRRERVMTTEVTSKEELSITAFPNPAKDWITLSLTGANGIDQLTIYSSSGQLIAAYTPEFGDQSTQINTMVWTKGLYLIKYKNQIIKIIKE